MTEWRVGNHYQIHVYEGDRPVATFHNPEDAQRAVRAVNGNGWQPIETAPKDGTSILFYDPNTEEGGSAFEGRFEDGWFDYADFFPRTPTHWMPLPEPPSET